MSHYPAPTVPTVRQHRAGGRLLALVLVLTGALFGALSAGLPTVAVAAPSHFNTNPYTTGCANSAYVLSSKAVSGGTARIMVSRACGSNWIDYQGKVQTTTKAGKDSATGRWTRTEVDSLAHAVSMQSYAPGNTQYVAYIKIGSTTTTATCSTGCTWTVTAPTPPTSTKAARAVAWARSTIGSNAYRGLCERFVENAYGTSGRYPSALDAYRALRAAGKISTGRTNIPAGALVFSDGPYDGPYGHVMLSEGGGRFISGGMINGASVQRLTTPNPGSTYLGWAMPPSSWPGR